MTAKLDQALTIIKSLPAEAQDAIADAMLEKAQLHREINEKLEAAERQLDAGQGIPVKTVIADLKTRYARS